MAVTSTVDQVEYTGTGSIATYQVPFYFLQAADLLLELQSAAGATPTTLIRDTDYSVAGAGVLTGGTITLLAGNLALGAILTIARDPALTQETTFQAQGPIPAAALNNGLDLATMQIQATRRIANNALRFPLVESLLGQNAELPAANKRANTNLGFGASGLLQLNPASNGSGTSVIATRSNTPRLLADRFAEVADVMDYGATLTGDDTLALQGAINSLGSAGGIVYIPAEATLFLNTVNTYKGIYTYAIRITTNNITIRGGAGAKDPDDQHRHLVAVPGRRWRGSGGTYYSMTAPAIGDTSITLTTAGQASNFAVGDWVYYKGQRVHAAPTLDAISELNQVYRRSTAASCRCCTRCRSRSSTTGPTPGGSASSPARWSRTSRWKISASTSRRT